MFEPTGTYAPATTRYDTMLYKRCGASGLKLPAISLGFWHNFGDITPYDQMKALALTAFDHGITHFDLANNYGPEPGAAEKNAGRLIRQYLAAHRDELVISTKAGYEMWSGPYGDWGSRKYLLASLDQSLERLGLDYVDIFYHHRPDPRDSFGGNDGRARPGRRQRQGALCGPVELRRATAGAGGDDPR